MCRRGTAFWLPLAAAWSSGENVARGAEVTFIDRQGGKEREVMLV